jgi:hypothetical protein
MKYDYRLLQAIRAYEKVLQKNCSSVNGEVPKNQEKYILRINRWSSKIVNSEKVN